MSNWDVELKNTTIKNDRGMPFVTMMVPEGWSIVYSEKRDAYCGHIYPYFIFLKLMSRITPVPFATPLPGRSFRIIWNRSQIVRSMPMAIFMARL